MKFPLVTRSHFEDVSAELRTHIAEQKALNKILMERLGLVEPTIPQVIDTLAQEADQTQDPFTPFIGRNRRLSSIVRMAEKKAIDAFKEKYPVTAELDELEAQGRAIAHGS